jgi:putative intracellular protease/amidase
VAVPWRALTDAGHDVMFATADGSIGACDPDMLSGVLLGQVKALPEHAEAYAEMAETDAFRSPIRYADIEPDRFDLLVLPGGHAQGMRQYLEDTTLQHAVVEFFRADAPVGAICHGTVVLARSVDPMTGESVVHGRTLTGLPKRFEKGAWLATKATRGDYFRTYPEWVQDEVRRAIGPDGDWLAGPLLPIHGKGFVVEDGALITARWPGDAERFGAELVDLLARRGLSPTD